MLRFIFVILLIPTLTNVKAQLLQTARFEVEKKFYDNNFMVVPADEKGIMLLRESDEKAENAKGNVWQIISLDNNLNEQWDTLVVVDYKYLVLGYDYSDGYLYLLFGEEFVGRKNVFKIVRIAKEDGSVEKFESITELEMQPTHLIINDEQLVLGGEINSRLTFVAFNYKDDKVMVIPGFFNKRSIILDFNYNEEHQIYNILLAEKSTSNRNVLAIKIFNKDGDVFIDEKIEFDEEIRPLNGKVQISKDLRIYYSGSYGGYNSYYSQGMYFGYLEGGKKPKTDFYTLTEFENIFDFMTVKRAKKIRMKIEKGIERKKPFEFKTQLWVQDFYEKEDFFVLLSDIYRPEYEEKQDVRYSPLTDSGNDTNQKYVHYTSGITNADGSDRIEYKEAILMLFNNEGKLLTDMSLPTPNAETLSLDKLSSSYVSLNKSSIVYKDENSIRYKLYDKDFNTVSDSLQNISVFVEEDETIKMTDNEGRVEKWYDNHFFVWGYHRISNQFGNKRNVFYINKITIED